MTTPEHEPEHEPGHDQERDRERERVRERRDDDLPALERLLAEQREAGSEYPLRWPLPFPVRDFLVRPTEERAWVAELDGRVVGHVAVTGLGSLGPAFAEAIEVEAGTLRAVSVLFTDPAVRGRGVGARLLEVAVDAIRRGGHRPVLDVVPTHAAAVSLYRSRGWREVGRLHPDWLPPERDDLVLLTLDQRPARGAAVGPWTPCQPPPGPRSR